VMIAHAHALNCKENVHGYNVKGKQSIADVGEVEREIRPGSGNIHKN
jgi:hypothetical protein